MAWPGSGMVRTPLVLPPIRMDAVRYELLSKPEYFNLPARSFTSRFDGSPSALLYSKRRRGLSLRHRTGAEPSISSASCSICSALDGSSMSISTARQAVTKNAGVQLKRLRGRCCSVRRIIPGTLLPTVAYWSFAGRGNRSVPIVDSDWSEAGCPQLLPQSHDRL